MKLWNSMKNKIGGRFYLSINDYIFDLHCFIVRQINLNIFYLYLNIQTVPNISQMKMILVT